MHHPFHDTAESLRQLGWAVELRENVADSPQVCTERFVWLPDDVVNFLCSFDRLVSPDEQAWLITWLDLSGESDSAFAWNEWEQISLSSAEGNDDWRADILAFWDEHFPLLQSVKSGYAYVAIRKDYAIVMGEESEFEEAVKIADDFSAFLRMLCESDSCLDCLI